MNMRHVGGVIAWGVAGVFIFLATPSWSEELHLVCDGTATIEEGAYSTGFAFGSRGGFASGNGFSSYKGHVNEQVLVDLTGDAGTVQLPPTMFPPLHGKSDGGRLSLDWVHMGDTQIEAKFSFNFMNHPSISINRTTGHINIKESERRGFSGDCRTYDPDAKARKF